MPSAPSNLRPGRSNKTNRRHSGRKTRSRASTPAASEEEAQQRRRDKMLERRGRTSKIRATSMHFTSYQLAKFDAIEVVLGMNKTVIWSDTDAVWMNRCAYDMLKYMPAAVDVAGQRGLFPTTLSLVTGTCLCSGFFMLRPTAASLALVKAVRVMLLASEDDQSALNKALLELGAFNYGTEQAEVPLLPGSGMAGMGSGHDGAIPRLLNKTIELGMDAKVAESGAKTTKTTLVRRRRRGVDNSTQTLFTSPRPASKKPPPSSRGRGFFKAANKTITGIYLGLLPYNLFPRGQVSVPVTQAMTREEKSEYIVRKRRSANETSAAARRSAATAASAPIDSERNEQAIEWRKFAHQACIWHMVSAKEGRTKVVTMKRDGVYRLTAAAGWAFEYANTTYTVEDVHRFLYS